MTLFRIRRWGTTAWTQVEINSDEEEDTMESETSSRVRDMLSDSGLHVQECDEEGNWEDVA